MTHADAHSPHFHPSPVTWRAEAYPLEVSLLPGSNPNGAFEFPTLHISQCAFAGTIGTHDGVYLARFYLQVQPVEDGLVGDGGVQILDLKHIFLFLIRVGYNVCVMHHSLEPFCSSYDICSGIPCAVLLLGIGRFLM